MHKLILIPIVAILPACATWGTHVRTAGTLAEYIHERCGSLKGAEQERCIADELARWAECAAETAPEDADTDGAADPGE